MIFRRRRVWLVLVAILATAIRATQGQDEGVEFFETRIRPVLVEHCYECHSAKSETVEGGLRLDSRAGLLRGGDSGPAIAAGQADQSRLIQALRYESIEMPPSGRLPESVVGDFVKWIDMGAPDPRDGDPVPERDDRAEWRAHWAFQPVRDSVPPPVKTPGWANSAVDRFLLSALEQQGIQPVPDADRPTWLRRVCLDLIGLPPTPDEIASFVADPAPDACERVLDRLLQSPAFGERWGRHWLDLVGYADQVGTSNDIFAEHAWRYRDYVIEAFNSDTPFDRFVREQIAGDLLPADSTETRAAQITATGFLVLGDVPVVEADKAKLRVDVVDQQVDKLGKAMLGMTIGCARCHDHKFDPISQHDYYALAGFFFNTESVYKAKWGVWSAVTSVPLPETPAQQAARAARAAERSDQLAGWQRERDEAAQRLVDLDAQLKSNPAAESPPEPKAARDAVQKQRDEAAARIRQLDQKLEHGKFFAPAEPQAYAVRDLGHPVDMAVTVRGNAHALGEVVPRGFLTVASAESRPSIDSGESGRRQLADWLVSDTNPLSGRVVVNRIWQKLFGAGIVPSVDYLGRRGETPTHPELLDYLATQFVQDDWSQKRLIQRLIASRAYRMSSEPNTQAQAIDPENRFLWRMNARRLDAEALRDSVLAVSGQLVRLFGRPSLPLEFPENVGNLDPGNVNPPSFRLVRFRPEQPFERTVYLPVIRSGPQPGPAELRNVFDFTQPAEMAGQRPVTAVPTQALFIMNAPLLKERARDLARNCLAAPSDKDRLEDLWLRVLCRSMTPSERGEAAAFLEGARAQLTGADAAEVELAAWSELCHALLGSNEFLMRL